MSTLRHLTLTAVAVLTAGALLTGCDTVDEPTLTKEQAVARVEALAQETFAQLPAGATLTLRASLPDVRCDDNRGGAFVENTYAVEYPDGWPVEQSMTTLADYWASRSYRTVRDERADPKVPELVVETPGDEFRIGYVVTHRDNGAVDPALRTSSPCYRGA